MLDPRVSAFSLSGGTSGVSAADGRGTLGSSL